MKCKSFTLAARYCSPKHNSNLRTSLKRQRARMLRHAARHILLHGDVDAEVFPKEKTSAEEG